MTFQKCNIMFNMVGIVREKIFLNITTLILSFVYNPNIQTGGILLLPLHYYKLLEINFSSSICFVAALNPINTHLLLFLLFSPFPVAINPVVNDRRGPEKSLGRLEGTLGRLGAREEGGVTLQGIGGRGNKICSTNTKQQCALLLVSDTIMTIITVIVMSVMNHDVICPEPLT